MGQFRKRRTVGSRFQKLSWHRGCDVVSNLLARFYFSNFWVFHSALVIQLIQVMRVRLAHLRVNFQIICCGYDSGHLRGHFFSRSHRKWPTIGTHWATKINHCYRFVQIKLKVCYQSLVRIFTISIFLFLATILSLQVAIGTFRVKK